MKLWTADETLPFVTSWRQATVIRVIDGDTLDLAIHLGFDVLAVARIRLLREKVITTPQSILDDGVDAWETRGAEREAGLAAKARVQALCPRGSAVRVYSRKGGSRGKWGRWLAAVLYSERHAQTGVIIWRSLGDTLIQEGHAEVWP
jgi:endonuclease YncB( thermonuclease family)